jgi:hypothetical protein
MSKKAARPSPPQNDLDQEQAAADLDQGIADREQARADQRQGPLDVAQKQLQGDLAASGKSSRRSRALRDRQSGLAAAQDRADVHQAQLDDNQRGQSVRQTLLDDQQAGMAGSFDDTAGLERTQAQAIADLRDALRRRAELAVVRAEQARNRAAETVRRLEALELRER